MEVNSIAALATDMSNERLQQAVGIAVLRKALDAQQASAAILLDAVAQSSPARTVNLPAHLGQNVDTTA